MSLAIIKTDLIKAGYIESIEVLNGFYKRICSIIKYIKRAIINPYYISDVIAESNN